MTTPRRVLFVTVGTTALGASNLGGLGEGAADLQEEARACLNGTDPAPDLFARVVAAHRAFWRTKWPVYQSPFYTSAEMASSWYALRLQRNDRLFEPEKDRIVLLASDTTTGKFCAHVNQELMKEYLFSPPCSKSDSISVSLEVITGLEAKQHGFGDNLAASLEQIWGRHEASGETIVNITGGFKGTIPALTWRCMRVVGRPCSMFYTHESMDRAETITFAQAAQPTYATRPIII